MLTSTYNMSANQQYTPTVVYPHHLASSSPSDSNGSSFVPAYIVLGIIAFMTITSCLLGPVCARRYLRPRQRRDHVPYNAAADQHHLHRMEAGGADVTSNAINFAATAAVVASVMG